MGTKVPRIEIKSGETILLKREEHVSRGDKRIRWDKGAFCKQYLFPLKLFRRNCNCAPNCMCRVQFANSILDLTSWTRDIRAFLKTSPPCDEIKLIGEGGRKRRVHPLVNRSHLFFENLVEFHSKHAMRNTGYRKTRINR